MVVLDSSRQLRRAVIALAAAASVALAASPPADAHSFLIRSDPAAGARLAKSPPALTLYFSEPFVGASEQVTLRRVGDATLKLPQPTSSGATVRQPLPARLHGVYVVHWRVLSDDGHISLGEFAFAVGSSAALPSLNASTTRTSWSEVTASWLIFVGLALGLGGLASERCIWRRMPPNAEGIPAAPALIGVGLALVGAVLQLLLLAGDRRGGGFSAGLSATAVGDALATRPGKLTLALIVSVLIAASLLPLRRLRLTATVPLLGAAGFIAARGHSGTSGHGWAVVADMIHLTAVAVWLGALAHLVLVAVRSGDAQVTLTAGAQRYARFALPTVILISATGVLTAIPEFRSFTAVFTSSYGRTLLIKAALIALALLLALAARQWALPANPRPRLPLLKRLTASEATVLAAVLVVVAVLVNAAPPRGAATAAPTAQLGPPPVAGPSLQLADLAGQLGLAITAGANELQFTVVPPGTQRSGSLKLTADARRPDGRAFDLYPRPCGSTCFAIRVRLTPGTTVVRAHLSSSAWRGGTVSFAIPWPLPRERPELLRRVVAAMNAVPALMLNEAVTSGFGSGGRPTAYRLSGRAFIKTELYGSGAVDIREIGRERGLTQLAFAFPGSNIWYRVWFDGHYRLRREMILSPGHLIQRSFRYGTTATAVAPPPTSSPSLSATGGVPAPPAGAVVLGHEDSDLAVGLALRSSGARLELRTTVLGPDGGGLSGLDVSYRVDAVGGKLTASAGACGSGCYRATVTARGRPQRVLVRLGGRGRAISIVAFDLPPRWPPQQADKLLRRATRTFRSLRTLVIDERLASSPSNVLFTTWQLAAPDKLTYRIKGGAEAIIIGARRWDRDPGGPWKESAQLPLRQPTPAWVTSTNAHVIGESRVAGRSAWLISFYDSSIPAFFTIAVEKATLRTLELRMTAAAHFMHHRYSRFNVPLNITPPP